VASRLSGSAALEAHRQRAEQVVRDALGEARFGELRSQGEQHQLEHVTALALGDADKLFGAPVTASAPERGPLTSREREIAALVAKGLSSREIAVRLTVAKRTVDSHIEHIFTKLGVSSRIQLINRLGAWTAPEDGAADS
jgi:DNA-binding NarL/FixJ family response regulator